MHIIALLVIGFSLWTAILLIVGNILQQQGQHRCSSKVAGFMLIAGLAGIQFLHLGVLLHRFDGFHSIVYTLLLYCIAPSFYFYSRQLLIADMRYRWRDVFHVTPFIFCLALPYRLALPCAF